MDLSQYSELIPWINLVVMVLATIVMFILYTLSARPAQLEKKIGEIAYKRSARYRIIASVFEFIVIGTFIVYYYYPLPISLPQTFPWDYWISFLVAVILGVPGGYVMFRGVLDAGEDSVLPKKKHGLYGGIYKKIRHPQAMGEIPLWFAFGFFLNSPFLVIYAVVFIPIFVTISLAEEKDLLIRYGDKYAKYKQNTGFIIPKSG